MEEADAASAMSLAEREWPEDEEELAAPDAELSEPAEGASGPPSPGSLPGTGPGTQPQCSQEGASAGSGMQQGGKLVNSRSAARRAPPRQVRLPRVRLPP